MKKIVVTMVAWMLLMSCTNSTKESKTSGDTTNVSKDTTTTPPDQTNTSNNNANMPITWKEFMSGNDCNEKQARNLVITSQEQLDALLSKAFSKDNQPVRTGIDFTKNSVIAIFLGTVNTGGHSVVITSIESDGSNGYKIGAEHKLPGKSCITSQAVEYPYYLAITDAPLTGKTEFSVKNKEVECE